MPTVMVSLLGKHPRTRVSANPVDARIGAYVDTTVHHKI